MLERSLNAIRFLIATVALSSPLPAGFINNNTFYDQATFSLPDYRSIDPFVDKNGLERSGSFAGGAAYELSAAISRMPNPGDFSTVAYVGFTEFDITFSGTTSGPVGPFDGQFVSHSQANFRHYLFPSGGVRDDWVAVGLTPWLEVTVAPDDELFVGVSGLLYYGVASKNILELAKSYSSPGVHVFGGPSEWLFQAPRYQNSSYLANYTITIRVVKNGTGMSRVRSLSSGGGTYSSLSTSEITTLSAVMSSSSAPSVVPEPSSLALVALSSLAIAGKMWRRRKRSD